MCPCVRVCVSMCVQAVWHGISSISCWEETESLRSPDIVLSWIIPDCLLPRILPSKRLSNMPGPSRAVTYPHLHKYTCLYTHTLLQNCIHTM